MENRSELQVDAGMYTTQGVKPVNEDSVGVYIPDEAHKLKNKGICTLVADGVSTAEAGKQASETTVKQFIEDYYHTPDTWSVEHSGENIVSAINLKLYRLSNAYKVEGKGYLCTLSAAIIKSRTAHIFQVGDSRVYLYRKGELKQLSEDHTVFISKTHEVLSRAVGMDSKIHIDYSKFTLEKDDIIMCCSDGVNGFIDDESIANILSQGYAENVRGDTNAVLNAQQLSQALCDSALEHGSDDNISANVVKINQLDSESIDDFNARLMRLPFPPELNAGMTLDGFEVLSEIYASSRSQLYKVKDIESGKIYVMKTPSVNFEEDNHYIDRFIQEEWIGKRIQSPYVVSVLHLNREKSFLYYVLELVEGITLSDWIAQNPHPDPTIAMNIIEQIAAGLRAFHSNDTVHQDLRPSNIMIDNDGQVKIVDFGSVYVAGLAEVFIPITHEGALGTASYADPLYLQGRNTGVRGDLYSLATIAYEIFTSNLPYGEKIEECSDAMDYDRLRYKPSNKHNPIIPIWFDRVLEKGVKFNLEERYLSIRQFIKDLKHPNPEFLRDDPKVEYTKSPLLFWQFMSVFWVVMLFAMVMLFSG